MKNCNKNRYLFLQSAILIFSFLFVFLTFRPMDAEEQINVHLEYVDFYLEKETYYIAKDTEFMLDVYNPQNMDYTIKLKDENIASIEENRIYSKQYGKTEFAIYIGNAKVNAGILYVVKGIEKIPNEFNAKKEKITCNYFTKEENDILDLTLKDRIESAGYQTRAGVVAAARFLTMEFDKRIPYFYENGRLNNYGEQKYVDGEGRYYHQGLYLNESRYNDIVASFTGPAAWGCKLKQYEDAKWYGFIPGMKYPNGLDCSGFVSWTLLNGGFDVKDSGAGDIISIKDDLYDLGKKEKLNKTLLNSEKIKVGDLIAYPGHMALIIGISSDGYYYIAESLPQFKGVVMNKYTAKELLETFTDVMLMDSVYLSDGNITNMWY